MSSLLFLVGLAAFGTSSQEDQPPIPVFEAQTLDDGVSIGYGLAVGDVDGDGRPDVLLADKTRIVWYRNGDWKRFVMAEDLTERDNVCIAARDVTGDGRVEVAVGARWNPGETTDPSLSGSIHYLIRPDDPTQKWEVVDLPHEPTVHRMRWVRSAANRYSLVVVPLHGRNNRGGEGPGVRILAYQFPENPRENWPTVLLDDSLNMTHNFEVVPIAGEEAERLYVGGRQGVISISPHEGRLRPTAAEWVPGLDRGTGEIRHGRLGELQFLASIEPMHGHELAVYLLGEETERRVLYDGFHEGHALATGDLLGLGRDQIVAGWRKPDAENRVGLKLFVPLDEEGRRWQAYAIDHGVAVEDLLVADLDGDGRPEIIASGRDTGNLVVYWNRTGSVSAPRSQAR